MSEVVINARFVGADGSLKYKRDKTYTLRVMCDTIKIEGKKVEGLCTYGSIAAFFENWTDVKVILRK